MLTPTGSGFQASCQGLLNIGLVLLCWFLSTGLLKFAAKGNYKCGDISTNFDVLYVAYLEAVWIAIIQLPPSLTEAEVIERMAWLCKKTRAIHKCGWGVRVFCFNYTLLLAVCCGAASRNTGSISLAPPPIHKGLYSLSFCAFTPLTPSSSCSELPSLLLPVSFCHDTCTVSTPWLFSFSYSYIVKSFIERHWLMSYFWRD